MLLKQSYFFRCLLQGFLLHWYLLTLSYPLKTECEYKKVQKRFK